MMFFTTYMKVAIKNYLGRCSVKGCEEWIGKEDLVISIRIGANQYHLCCEHGTKWWHADLTADEIEMDKYSRWPSKEDLKQSMLEAIEIIKEALQE